MPFRLRDPDGRLYRAKMQIEVAARLPSLLHKAAQEVGDPSNSAYVRRVLCEQIAADLGMDAEELLAEQPVPRDSSLRTMEDVV